MSLPVVHEDSMESPTQKRNRLASELRYLASQFNSKVGELLELGLEVYVGMGDCHHEDREALIGNVEVSYQTPRKYY